MDLVELMQGSGEGGFHGVIRDATNNNPIPDIMLCLYKGWDNPAEPGTYLKKWTTGTTDENPVIIETMSPTMSDGYYRIVLTWGATPSDLDSRLVANTDVGSDIHVYFGDIPLSAVC